MTPPPHSIGKKNSQIKRLELQNLTEKKQKNPNYMYTGINKQQLCFCIQNLSQYV